MLASVSRVIQDSRLQLRSNDVPNDYIFCEGDDSAKSNKMQSYYYLMICTNHLPNHLQKLPFAGRGYHHHRQQHNFKRQGEATAIKASFLDCK